MAKLFINFLVFGISLQIVCYLIWSFNLFGNLIHYPLGDASNILSLNNMFSLDLWSALIGVTGVLISVAALLLRQGTYAVYALLLFALGIFFNIIKSFILAIPNTIAALVPDVPAAAINPIQIVVGVMVVFGGFMYFFGLVIQREPM